MPAGYSKRTLADKLGIKPGAKVTALGAPASYPTLLGQLPEGASLHSRLPASSEFIHQFSRSRSQLADRFPRLAGALADQGSLWISWPKQASGVETDLNENVVRELGLANGLVDVKVCAVDDVWSGLKFVRRVRDRGSTYGRSSTPDRLS
jgi:hypothetical protein